MGPGNADQAPLLAQRTVPIALRPPNKYNSNLWAATMAIAPSQLPPGAVPVAPAPRDPLAVTLDHVGGAAGATVTLAVQHNFLSLPPGQADFEALCDMLEANLASELPGWAVDPHSRYTPTHARYYSQQFKGPQWEMECWLGVVKK